MSKQPLFHWLNVTLLVALLGLTACQPIQPLPAAPPISAIEAKIQVAMSSAPSAIAQDATILDWPTAEGGAMVVIREGTNGWTCFTDWPVSPGEPDPACYDAVWNVWNEAFAKGEAPVINAVGIGYMLAGGVDPSNTDPFALEPAPGEDWVTTPPHMMILAPGGFDPASFTTDHHAGQPYIMFEGTPYEHLMVPTTLEAIRQEADLVQNAMSAAPAAVVKDATVLGWPATAGGEMTELRKGTNGWTCFPDDPGFPTNDPMCLDAMWLEWFKAYSTQTEPHYTAVGIGYMLQGGSAASNDDPYATAPPAGHDWMIDPPHVMIVAPGKLDPALFSTDPNAGGPYIMWAGTPYEHLMVPVAELSK